MCQHRLSDLWIREIRRKNNCWDSEILLQFCLCVCAFYTKKSSYYTKLRTGHSFFSPGLFQQCHVYHNRAIDVSVSVFFRNHKRLTFLPPFVLGFHPLSRKDFRSCLCLFFISYAFCSFIRKLNAILLFFILQADHFLVGFCSGCSVSFAHGSLSLCPVCNTVNAFAIGFLGIELDTGRHSHFVE